MVTFFRFFFLLILAWGFSLNSCNVDLVGLFDSNGLDTRMQAHNSPELSRAFDFLSLDDDYSFIVLSDTHLEDNILRKLDKLKKVIDDEKISFVVFNGDITQNGSKTNVEIFLQNTKYLDVPCFPVVGNHDVYFNNWPIWKELLGPTRYRVDGDNTTLFMLDTANAYFGSQQLDWLEKELKKANKHVFVFTHTNLFIQSPVDIQQFTDIRERARFTSMLKGRCDAVFTGHVHRRVVTTVGGVPYITTEAYIEDAAICVVKVKEKSFTWEFKKL